MEKKTNLLRDPTIAYPAWVVMWILGFIICYDKLANLRYGGLFIIIFAISSAFFACNYEEYQEELEYEERKLRKHDANNKKFED